MPHEYLTIGDVATHYRVALWQARRAVDALGKTIPRAGLYRLVPRELLGEVGMELKRRGWLKEATERDGDHFITTLHERVTTRGRVDDD